MGDEITRLRPPRFFQQDGLVRPYVRMEAEGNKLLQVLLIKQLWSVNTILLLLF
jgi:hypothetical protein